MRFSFVVVAVGLALGSASAQAQRGGGPAVDSIPKAYRPPAGMCRVWLPGVPPGKQPAPTDCATAVRNRPANGRIIFGDSTSAPGRAIPQPGRTTVPAVPPVVPPVGAPPTATPPRPTGRGSVPPVALPPQATSRMPAGVRPPVAA
jgi:hypothetical protein